MLPFKKFTIYFQWFFLLEFLKRLKKTLKITYRKLFKNGRSNELLQHRYSLYAISYLQKIWLCGFSLTFRLVISYGLKHGKVDSDQHCFLQVLDWCFETCTLPRGYTMEALVSVAEYRLIQKNAGVETSDPTAMFRKQDSFRRSFVPKNFPPV